MAAMAVGVVLLGAAYLTIQNQSGTGVVAAPVAATNAPVVDVAALKTKAEAGDPAAQTSRAFPSHKPSRTQRPIPPSDHNMARVSAAALPVVPHPDNES